jgi:hypothetical protein
MLLSMTRLRKTTIEDQVSLRAKSLKFRSRCRKIERRDYNIDREINHRSGKEYFVFLLTQNKEINHGEKSEM